jgi:hypothetical protein
MSSLLFYCEKEEVSLAVRVFLEKKMHQTKISHTREREREKFYSRGKKTHLIRKKHNLPLPTLHTRTLFLLKAERKKARISDD